MIDQAFNLLFLFSLGVLFVFGFCVVVHFSMKKGNQSRREAALKIQSEEAGNETD